MDFETANQQEHPVENEWHYPILMKYGFIPNTLVAIGFVRRYLWTHPTIPNQIQFNIGVNADHWSDNTTRDSGYWGTLEDHLIKLTQLNKIEN